MVEKSARTNVSSKPTAAVKVLVQPKLAINRLGDQYGQEAHRVTGQVMRVPAPPAPTPLEQAKDLLQESASTPKDRAKWLLKAADCGFVTFNTDKAKQNLLDIQEEKKVESLDPKAAGYEIPILPVEVGLVKKNVQRWVDADGKGDKQSIEFGSMIRTSGDHAKGQAIDINKLDMTASVEAAIQILEDLDKTIYTSYGLGFPFQGEFFDPDDEMATKKTAAEQAAGKDGKTASITDAIKKFTSHLYQTTGTKSDDGNWKWSTPVIQEAGGAYKRLKSQSLKDKLATRRKDGLTFMIFPDNDNHLHIETN